MSKCPPDSPSSISAWRIARLTSAKFRASQGSRAPESKKSKRTPKPKRCQSFSGFPSSSTPPLPFGPFGPFAPSPLHPPSRHDVPVQQGGQGCAVHSSPDQEPGPPGG